MSWFRYHTDALDNPKIQTLPAVLFRFWVNLLCVSKKVDGFLPESSEISFRCRVPEPQVKEWLAELKKRRLVDETAEGELVMHDWNEHQFVSDDVTARVRKHRAKRKGNVSVTPPEQSRADNRADDRAEAAPGALPKVCEFPETAAAVRHYFAAADDGIVAVIAQLSFQAYADVVNGSGKAKPLTDSVIAAAVRAAHFPKQTSPGLFREKVPRVIRTWAEEAIRNTTH